MTQVDNGDVISAQASRSWRRFQAVNLYLSLGGGALMFLVAAITQDSNSVPLLAIGSFWIAGGLVAIWQRPRIAREVRLEDERITFVFPAKELTMPAGDVIEIRRPLWDPQHWAWFRFRTQSHGTLRVAARLRGLFDLLAELRRLNPRVTYPDS